MFHKRKICNVSRMREVHSFVSEYCVCCVSIENILNCMSEVQHNTKIKRFAIKYLCVLLVGDGVKCRLRLIIR
jgi:hypothetical protein